MCNCMMHMRFGYRFNTITLIEHGFIEIDKIGCNRIFILLCCGDIFFICCICVCFMLKKVLYEFSLILILSRRKSRTNLL